MRRRASVSALLAGLSLTAAAPSAGPREAVLAGSWYPGSRSALVTQVVRLFRSAAKNVGPPPAKSATAAKPIALVVPHAGWQYSGAVAATAFAMLAPGDASRVVLLGPSHYVPFRGFSIESATAYRTPLGDTPLCADAANALRDGDLVRDVPGAAAREHSLEVELPFLQVALRSFCLVPIVAGETSPEQEKALAAKLAALDDGKTLFVFSSDLTHYGPRYGYAPYGPSARAVTAKIKAQDDRALDALQRHDAAAFRKTIEDTGATICGRSDLGVAAELLARIAPNGSSEVRAHYASIDIAGNSDDNAVDYAALAFFKRAGAGKGRALDRPAPAEAAVGIDAPALTAQQGSALVRIARASLETELRGGDELRDALAGLPASGPWDRLQAVFVTLNRTDAREIASAGKLRGCIGQLVPVHPLFAAVSTAAVDAAENDPRFEPVQAAELPKLAVEVTVLSAPRPIASWNEFRIGTHGIILSKNGRRAVFLPQVAPEQGWNVEQTLTALAQKAGLPGDAWRQGATFEVFTGQVFDEQR